VTGHTAKTVSAFRPEAKIIAVSHDETTRNQLALVWGVEPLIVKATVNFNTFFEHVMEEIRTGNGLRKGDKVVMIVGTTAGVSGTTNTIKIATV
jgi:pyruvate kinase